MTLTLVATPKATNANTYSTLAEAETYHESVYAYDTTWADATNANKNISLVMATRGLDDLMEWFGYATTTTQSLRAPRYLWYTPDGVEQDRDTNPQWLINATAEFSRHILVGDRYIAPSGEGFMRLKAGPIELERDANDTPLVLPPSVWAMVRHYGGMRDPKAAGTRIRLVR